MKNYLVILLLMFQTTFIYAATIYVYPPAYTDPLKTCSPNTAALSNLIANQSSGKEENQLARFDKAFDINNDGICEISLLPPREYIGNSGGWFDIYMLKDNLYKHIMSVPNVDIETPENWLGEMKNSYPRIFYGRNIGQKSNPIFVMDVYYFNGTEYEIEFESNYTIGNFKDFGLNAYKQKNYTEAEKWYLNAYRMNRESNLTDANNLALALIKQNKCIEAVSLLNKHLLSDNNYDEKQIKSAKFNIGLCEKNS